MFKSSKGAVLNRILYLWSSCSVCTQYAVSRMPYAHCMFHTNNWVSVFKFLSALYVFVCPLIILLYVITISVCKLPSHWQNTQILQFYGRLRFPNTCDYRNLKTFRFSVMLFLIGFALCWGVRSYNFIPFLFLFFFAFPFLSRSHWQYFFLVLYVHMIMWMCSPLHTKHQYQFIDFFGCCSYHSLWAR